MKITVKREQFIEALEKVRPAVMSKANLAIITNYLLEAKGGKVIVQGTDLSIALIARCPGKVIQEGKVLLSGKIIPFLKALTCTEISLGDVVKVEKYTEKKWAQDPATQEWKQTETPAKRRHVTLQLGAGMSTASFPVKDPKDYPPVPEVPESMPLRFSDLVSPMGKVVYAAGKDISSRPVLEGVCIKQGDKRTEAAAADGFRLAVTPINMRGKLEKPAIIPRQACDLLSKTIGPITAGIREDANGHRVMFFAQKGLTLAANLIAGDFPNYAQLIPTKNMHTLSCKADDVRTALKQVKAFDPSNGTVRLQTRGHVLNVSTTVDGNEFVAKMPAKGKVKTGYDPKFLQDLLAHMNGTFQIKTSDGADNKGGPTVARIGATTHVLMPKVVQR